MAHRRAFGYIRKLPSGRFQASYITPAGDRRTAPKPFANKTDAGEWLTRVKVGILDGRWRDPVLGRQLLVTYASTWIDQRAGLRPRTVDLYRWLLKRHIEPHLARTRLDDLTPLVIRRWRSTLLEAGVSQSMAAKAYRLLRAVLNTAVDDDILERNPCRIRSAGDENPAERSHPERGTGPGPGDAHATAVLGLRARHDLRVPALGRDHRSDPTRCRPGHRHGQRPHRLRRTRDRSPGTRAAEITRECPSRRPAPAGRRTAAGTPGRLRRRRTPDALVFTGPSGRPLRRSNFNKQVRWEQARATLGVPNLHLHDLRHTGNTLAAATPGTSTRDLMERMGHDTMRAALIYQHSTRDAGRRIADALQAEIERATRTLIVKLSHARPPTPPVGPPASSA